MTFLNRKDILWIGVLALLLLVVFPLALDAFRLNLVGKYLTYGFVVLGLVLCWGDAGILSLGQGVFFGLGGYCMAMFLKLEASTPEATKIQSTPGIPDFMDWNQITSLPWFWQPFHSLVFTILAVPLVPMLLALIIGAGNVHPPGRRHLLRDHHPGDRRDPDHPDHRPAGLHRRRQRHHRPAHAATAGTSGRTTPRSCCISSTPGCCWAACCWRSSSAAASSGASWWPCATRRTGCGSPATTSRTSRCSCSASPPRWPGLAARCSRCRSASCRRPSSASCRRSRW